MSNMMICYPNRIDAATLSGGAWSATLPLGNAQDPLLGVRSRSASADVDDTVIEIDLGRIRPIRAVAVIDHNLSVIAEYRITVSDVAGFDAPLFVSDWMPVFDILYPYGSVAWEDERFWTGRASADDIEGYRLDLIHVLPGAELMRSIRIEIRDPDNAAGFIEFGRLFIGDGFSPLYNISYGNSIQYQARTDVAEALSGAETFDVRPPRRVQRASLDWLSDAEAMGSAFELQRRVGVHGEVLYLHDPDDAINRHRRCFLGRLRALSAIEHPYVNTHRMPIEIQEIL